MNGLDIWILLQMVMKVLGAWEMDGINKLK